MKLHLIVFEIILMKQSICVGIVLERNEKNIH